MRVNRRDQLSKDAKSGNNQRLLAQRKHTISSSHFLCMLPILPLGFDAHVVGSELCYPFRIIGKIQSRYQCLEVHTKIETTLISTNPDLTYRCPYLAWQVPVLPIAWNIVYPPIQV